MLHVIYLFLQIYSFTMNNKLIMNTGGVKLVSCNTSFFTNFCSHFTCSCSVLAGKSKLILIFFLMQAVAEYFDDPAHILEVEQEAKGF